MQHLAAQIIVFPVDIKYQERYVHTNLLIVYFIHSCSPSSFTSASGGGTSGGSGGYRLLELDGGYISKSLNEVN